MGIKNELGDTFSFPRKIRRLKDKIAINCRPLDSFEEAEKPVGFGYGFCQSS